MDHGFREFVVVSDHLTTLSMSITTANPAHQPHQTHQHHEPHLSITSASVRHRARSRPTRRATPITVCEARTPLSGVVTAQTAILPSKPDKSAHPARAPIATTHHRKHDVGKVHVVRGDMNDPFIASIHASPAPSLPPHPTAHRSVQIGRASCRERV